MYTTKHHIEGTARILLVLVLLLSACGNPTARTSSNPAPAEGSPTSQVPTPPAIPQLTPQYFTPPQSTILDRTSPEADEIPSTIPPKPEEKPVELSLQALPAAVKVNETFSLKVLIQNNSDQDISHAVYKDTLDEGLQFVSGGSGHVSYDTDRREVSLQIDNISSHSKYTFDYYLKVTKAQDDQSYLWLHSGTLDFGGIASIASQVSFLSEKDAAAEGASVAALQPDGGWYSLGDVSVYLGTGAVQQDGVLVVTPLSQVQGPENQFSLDIYATDKMDVNSQGKLNDQTVGLTQRTIEPGTQGAYLEVSMDGVVNLDDIPAGQEPYIATYDEASQVWVKIPILDTDYANNTVTVKADHFSTWGNGIGDKLPQNGAGALLFDQPYTSLFTGAARYSVPIWTPTGRAGMAPSLSLSYSSATVDGVLGDVQAPWIGEGWNMDSTEIVRKITTTADAYGYQNNFALTLNGSLYEMIRDDSNLNRYYVKQNGFLYIERHNYAIGNEKDASGAEPVNETGEWWEVVTTDGVRYRLGWNKDSEQLALMYGYSCTLNGSHCNTPNGTYSSLGYAGNAKNLVARRWRVDQVMDPNGNFMTYQYQEYQPPLNAKLAAFDRESYLASIKFTGHYDVASKQEDLPPGYAVYFLLGDRSKDGDVPATFNSWDFVDRKYLQTIVVACLRCQYKSPGHSIGTPPNGDEGSGWMITDPVRLYNFKYSLETIAGALGNRTVRTLTGITVTGGDFTEQDEAADNTIPATEAAAVRFTYKDYFNRASNPTTSKWDQFSYPRLTTIENGYGGKLNYSYDNDSDNAARDYKSWYDYRVKQVVVDSGLAVAGIELYAYQTPAIYTGVGSNSNLGELVGYPTVTERICETTTCGTAKLETIHHFGTKDLDKGLEFSTEWHDPTKVAGTFLKKTVNTYVTDNSQAPFVGWNYRYLYQTENYIENGSTPISKVTYLNDPSTGNLLVQTDYLGTSVYRKTYMEYQINRASTVYILDKMSRQLTTDASNQVFSDARYIYNGQGNLIFTQTLTGNGMETVDFSIKYDKYGNATDSIQYKDFGVLNTARSDPPVNSNFLQSTKVYDATFETYPIEQVNSLGYVTRTEYIYSLGLPSHVNDPNNNQSATTYDGLGRILSITPPGVGQVGTWYSYPRPVNGSVGTPYSTEMKILDAPAGKYRSVWGIYDGLGHIIQNQIYDDKDTSSPSDDQLLISEVNFNVLGQVDKHSQPHFVTASNGGGVYVAPDFANLISTTTTYDPLGRITSVTSPADLTTITSYAGLTTRVTDPNGNWTDSTSDGLGRLIRVTESSYSQPFAITQYDYDIADRLIATIDAQSNKTDLSYNLLGQKTKMVDPDMGTWTYSYNPMGSLALQQDAREQTLSFTYDELGRLIQKTDATNHAILASYSYDGITPATTSPMIGEIGMRSYMKDQSGSTQWSYSDNGRTITQIQTIGDLTNTFINSSDWLGRMLTASSPDETLTYTYDSLGQPKNFSSSAYTNITLADLAYNQLGQISTMKLGTTSGASAITITNTYDMANRLKTRRALNSGGTTLINFSYDTYDNNGNITKLTDKTNTSSPITYNYTYDSLNRLLTASAAGGVTYNQSYIYDKIGDILQVSSLGIASDFGKANTQTASLLPEGGSASSEPISFKQKAPALQVLPTDTPTTTIVPAAFPSTGVIDNFNRSNGTIGTNWSIDRSQFTINSNQLKVLTQGMILWNPASYGADQEAFITFANVDPAATNMDLLLKSQSYSQKTSLLEVNYDPSSQELAIVTYTNTNGYTTCGTPVSIIFADGDQLGARANSDGTVLVYKNGSQAMSCDASYWPDHANGGYIGLLSWGSSGPIFDDFGGGTVVVSATATPTLTPSFTRTNTVPTSTLTLTNTVPTQTFTSPSTFTPTNTVATSTFTYTNTIPTKTSTLTATRTLTPVYTFTNTPTRTKTPSFTPSNTASRTMTPSFTFTNAPTSTPTATFTRTNTVTTTYTSSKTSTNTSTSTATATFTATVAVPAAPTSLSAVLRSGPQVMLSWTDNSTDETGFKIYRYLRTAQGGWSGPLVVAIPAHNATGIATYTDSTVTSGLVYNFEVRAVNAGGESVATNSVSITPFSSLVIPSVSPYATIGAGGYHTCFLTAGGEVKCVGENDSGQLGFGEIGYQENPTSVIGLPDGIAQISTGAGHTCILTNVGDVKCWGRNDYGQLGNSSKVDSGLPVDVVGLPGTAIAIAAGTYHTCALINDGTVYCWGYNSYGQLGNNSITTSTIPAQVIIASTPARIGLSGVTAIAVGSYHTCALINDKTVKCWGYNAYGELGDGTTSNQKMPVTVKGNSTDSLAQVTSISTGAYHTCAVSDRSVDCWGYNNYGQLGLGDGSPTSSNYASTVIGMGEPVAAISAGTYFNCALTTDNGVKCWGLNSNYRLGDGTTTNRYAPVDVSSLDSGVLSITAGDDHACALMADYRIKCWGYNYYGQLGYGTIVTYTTPVYANWLSGEAAVVEAGASHTCALMQNGDVKCWGLNDWGQLGNSQVGHRLVPVNPFGTTGNVKSIFAGSRHSCAITNDDKALCWGRNDFGQLGDGTNTDRGLPVFVPDLDIVSSLALGTNHTCALSSGGEVTCWGYNGNGQLGNGTTTNQNTPEAVSGLTGSVAAIAVNSSHSCALLKSGEVQCWGSNSSGQLGDGTTTKRTTPVYVVLDATNVHLTAAVAIAAGNNYTCALLSNGTVKCWGYNNYGNLGDGTSGTGTDKSYPVTVSGLNGLAVSIITGAYHTCALLAGGSIQCWGYNAHGELGNGTTANSAVPVNVSTILTGANQIYAGSYHMCSLIDDGSMKCWGNNTYGQLGDGTLTRRTTPWDVTMLTNAPTPTPAPTNTPAPLVTFTPSRTATRPVPTRTGPTYSPTASFTFTASVARTSTLVPSVTPTANLNVGLLSYWNFNALNGTQVPDVSGNLHHGQIYGSVMATPGGQAAQQLKFDGSTGYILVPSSTEYSTLNSFSISVWINPAYIAPDRRNLIVYKPNNYALLFDEDGLLQFRINLSANEDNYAQSGGVQLALNQWSLVTAVFEKPLKQLRLYVNGVLVSSYNSLNELANSGNSLFFGGYTNQERYNGLLDDIRFYNRVLTIDEIASLNNLALNKQTSSSSTNTTWGGESSRAVDGNTDGNFFNNSVTATNSEASPWWKVDLGAIYTIGKINIFNRTDVDWQRLSNYNVYILDANQNVVWTSLQTTYPNPSVTIDTGPGGVTGRYIRIQLTGTGILSLAEVQVFGVFKAELTPTPTWTPSATPTIANPWGAGSDGSWSINNGVSYNINAVNTPNAGGRSCADAVAYSVILLSTTSAVVETQIPSTCIKANEEVLLINLQGTSTQYSNVGQYEFLKVASVSGATITFRTNKSGFYGAGQYDDTNIGINAGQQRVMIQRVPNYLNLSIASGGVLTASPWNGKKYGVLAFRVSGTLSGAGTIWGYGLGFEGGGDGVGEYQGGQGASYAGNGTNTYTANFGGGGGGSSKYLSGAGAGYGLAGSRSSGYGAIDVPGNPYGDQTLKRLYLGSGGGGGAKGTYDAPPATPWVRGGGPGGRGGGIIFISANTVSGWTGAIHDSGADGVGGEFSGAGGGGSGGSIRIEGKTMNLGSQIFSLGGAGGSTNKSSGGAGNIGRIAVYYQGDTLPPFVSNPEAYVDTIYQPATPTPAPIQPGQYPWGTGNDGDLTVSASTNLNSDHARNAKGRTCADSVAYSVTSLTNSYAVLDSIPVPGCLKYNDEILLINLQGSSISTVNTGHYEFLRVGKVVNNQVFFGTQKVKFYGDGESDDTNIGISNGQQRVMLQRVPNYSNVAMTGGSLTINAWEPGHQIYKYGVLAFRVSGTLSASAGSSISADGKGYQGGDHSFTEYDTAQQGESYAGKGIWSASAGYGGGGGGNCTKCSGAGGGYGLAGDNTYYHAIGGNVYGSPELDRLYFGSGGGGGFNAGDGVHGGAMGGNGGGIVLLTANTISGFSGMISANGAASSQGPNSYYAGAGGGGSGGTIRVEGNTISLGGSISAAGEPGGLQGDPGVPSGGNGNVGRIAIYYMVPPAPSTTNPQAAYFSLLPPPIITPTPVAFVTPSKWGTGADGDISLSSIAVNLNMTKLKANRICPDGDAAAYSVSELGSVYAKLDSPFGYGCLMAGDEVLLINLQGSNGSHTANVGNYEFLHIFAVSGSTVYFTSPKSLYYGDGINDDINIGTADNQQKVMLQRVPNYRNVALNSGTLTINPWDGKKYGVLAFRVSGSLSGAAGSFLYADGKGYGGGDHPFKNDDTAQQGESYAGKGVWSASAGYGGGGGGNCNNCGGAGGGYGLPGANTSHNAIGGGVYGAPELDKLFFGSGGGGGYTGTEIVNGTPVAHPGLEGGVGGGIIFVAANVVDNFSGSISAKAGPGVHGANSYNSGAGGGGAGGSIRIEGYSISLGGSLSADGGPAGLRDGVVNSVPGNIGRSAIFYDNTFSGSVTPNYSEYTGPDWSHSAFSDDFESGNVRVGSDDPTAWTSVYPSTGGPTVTTAAKHNGNYGLQTSFNGTQPVYLVDSTPDYESHYRGRFYLNPNNVTLGEGVYFSVLSGMKANSNIFSAQLIRSGGNYQVRISNKLDDGSWIGSYQYTLAPGWNLIEVDYQPAHHSGQMSLYLNGVLMQTITGLDNDLANFDSIRFGMNSPSAAVSGSIYLDDFSEMPPDHVSDAIFSDSFESGDMRVWAFSTIDGDLTVSAAAAYSGNQGLQAVMNDTTNIYVADEVPSGESSYHARFYLNPNSIAMGSLDILAPFVGYTGTKDVFHFQLQKVGTAYQARIGALPDGTTTFTEASSWVPINNGWNAIEISYKPGHLNGLMRLWINGNLVKTLIGLDNDGRKLDTVRLGALGVDQNTSGTLYIDDFESRRFSYIGLLPDPGPHNPTPTPIPSMTNKKYGYGDKDHVHAVTDLNDGVDGHYDYDANGNMTCREENGQKFNQVYNIENRLALVQLLNTGIDCPAANTAALPVRVTASWSFAYDGDGNRVRQFYATFNAQGIITSGDTIAYFSGGSYEVENDGINESVTRYYSFAGQLVAMNAGTGYGLEYFLTDHLGSIIGMTNSQGRQVSSQTYTPFGGGLLGWSVYPSAPDTDYGYTGQRNIDKMGLMDYKARMYDPFLARFVQPDSVTPGGPQGLNRYTYVNNNPIVFTDPTGHCLGPNNENVPDSSSYCLGGGNTTPTPPTPPNPCTIDPGLPICSNNDDESNPYEIYNQPLPDNIDEELAKYGVTIVGDMPQEQRVAILFAVELVGRRLAKILAGYSAADAFLAVYENMKFVWGPCTARAGDNGCAIADDGTRFGGYTWGGHEIEFANNTSGWAAGTRPPAVRQVININLVIHELGHAFGGGRMASDAYIQIDKYGKADLLDSSIGYSTEPAESAWVQNSSYNSGDAFANTFVGWVYDDTFAEDMNGGYRREFMGSYMPGAIYSLTH